MKGMVLRETNDGSESTRERQCFAHRFVATHEAVGLSPNVTFTLRLCRLCSP